MPQLCCNDFCLCYRGLLALQTLYKLQNLTGKPVHQLFDYICGVSTGMILISSLVSDPMYCIISRDLLILISDTLPCHTCSVSASGAILAFMLGIFQIPLEECEEMYRKLGADVFKQNVIVGTVKMGWSHAFYDSEIWENILK